MSVFDYTDYKKCVNDWVQGLPKAGYGTYSRMAAHLGTNSVSISQIFRGDRDLSPEQAVRLCRFMAFGSLETDYFLLLVQIGKAGSEELRSILLRQLKDLRARSRALKNRVPHEQLTDEDKALFYSNWYFIGTWLAATLPRYSSPRALSAHFRVPEAQLSEVIRFLLSKQLLKRSEAGFEFGKNVVHVPHDSPHVNRHHMNWRMKAIQAMDRRNEQNLHYTAPMAMSEELRLKMREEIVRFIQRQTKLVAAAPSECLSCLSIDLFDF